MKRSRLSLPRPRDAACKNQESSEKDQQHRGGGGGKSGDGVCGSGSRKQAYGNNAVGLSPVSKASVTPVSPPNGGLAPTSVATAKTSPSKPSPQNSQKLPSSPWAHLSSRKRPLPSSPSPSQRRQDAPVIDLTEEACVPPNQDSRFHQQAEQRRAVGLPSPRSPHARPSELAAESNHNNTRYASPGFRPPTRTTPPSTTFSPTAAEEEHQADGDAEKERQRTPPPPPRSTYLRHFEDAVETVMRTRPDYARLFTPEEREVVQRFEQLSEPSKALYVRLFQRKGPWFRADGMLAYDEVGSGTPLWVRRRNAAATADAAAAVATGVVDGAEQCRQSTAFSPPLSPFAPAVGDAHSTAGCGGSEGAETESVPMITGLLDDAEEPKKGNSESGQGSTEPATAAVVAAPGEVEAAATAAAEEAAAIAAAAADSVAFTPRELTVLHEEIQRSLRELVEAGFLDALPGDVGRTGPGLEVCLAAVECCVRSPEMKSLLKRTGGSSKKTTPTRRQQARKPAGGRKSSSPGRGTKEARRKEATPTAAAAGGGRQGMVEELRRRLAGQQTLWGAKSPLVREIERLISASVEALGVDIATGTRCDSSGGGGHAGSRGNGRRRHWLVAVAGYPQLVFKRALRLMYLTCNTGALSSGRVGAASVRGAGVAGALSSWSPGLSAAFGKTRYASYACNPRARTFQGREDLLRWEAAVELRCALDGAMDELSRGRMASAEASAAATEAAGCAESQESEEREGEGEEDGTPAKSSTAEVFVLDSDGELENVEEALVAPKQEEEEVLGLDLESTAAEEEEKEEVRAAVSELRDMVAQFLPGGEEGHADRAAAAVTAAVNGATTRTPASIAIAIALVCSRCLHAHLATPAAALCSVVSSSAASPFPRGGEAVEKPQNAQEGQEVREEEEEEEEEVFLRSLKERCGISEEAGRDADRAEDCVRNQQQQPQQKEEERPAMPACPAESRHSTGEVAASEQPSTLGRGGHDPQANLVSELELPLPLAAEGRPTHGTAGAGGGAEGRGKETGGGKLGRKKDEVPEFLLQLEAGWVLASAVWEGVTLLERARDYDRAVELLSQLLSTRYTPHRRGRWWLRLSLDLAHTRRRSCALWASREGLRDPGVRGGDRLALEKRAFMLSARASKSQSSASSKTATAVLPKISRHPVESPPLSSSPKRNVPGQGTVGHGSDWDGAGGGEDDDDDAFEDPTIEREKRRALKLRRKERRRRKQQEQQQQEQQPAGAEGSQGIFDATGTSGSGGGGGSSGGGGDDGGGGGSGSSSSGSHDKRGCLGASDHTKKLGRDLRMDHEYEHGSKNDAPGAPSFAAAAAAAAAATAEKTLRCDGVAELSQVPNLLGDQSIAGVVLAATTTSEEAAAMGGADKAGGIGVPEMSITGRRLNREVGVKSRFVGYGDGAACTVESLVLQHLSQAEEGSWAGWHCEGSPLRALWALLMWDVIFTPVNDVFQTPFQDAPLDLDFCPLFYVNRRAAVDARLAQVRAASSTGLVALVGDAWLANAHTVCRGMNWERSSVRHLQAIAAGLGGPAVAAVLAALSLNYKHFGGGLPDLLLMRAVRTGKGAVGGEEEEHTVSAKGVEAARGVSKASAAASLPIETKAEVDTEVSVPGRFAAWLGVDSGVDVDVGVGENDDRAPLSGRGGGGGSAVNERTPLPPLEAADLEGLKLETWLLEVKGPSDRLSDRQTAWLRILDRGRALVGVCHVAEGVGGSHAGTIQPKRLKKDKS